MAIVTTLRYFTCVFSFIVGEPNLQNFVPDAAKFRQLSSVFFLHYSSASSAVYENFKKEAFYRNEQPPFCVNYEHLRNMFDKEPQVSNMLICYMVTK